MAAQARSHGFDSRLWPVFHFSVFRPHNIKTPSIGYYVYYGENLFVAGNGHILCIRTPSELVSTKAGSQERDHNNVIIISILTC